jgi:hypothetical protein
MNSANMRVELHLILMQHQVTRLPGPPVIEDAGVSREMLVLDLHMQRGFQRHGRAA